MRIAVRHLDPFPLSWATARGAGRSEGELARAAAAAALGSRARGIAGHPPGDRRRSPAGRSVSLSHRDGVGAAVVAAPGVRVGIDLERAGAVAPAYLRLFVTAAERRGAARAARAGRVRPADPTTLWALKEAAWKAFRCPADLPFTALELELDRAGMVRAVAVAGERHPARAALRRPWPGWIVALVWAEEAS